MTYHQNKGQGCITPGCTADAHCRRRCNKHYQRTLRWGRDDLVGDTTGRVWREEATEFTRSLYLQRKQGRGYTEAYVQRDITFKVASA